MKDIYVGEVTVQRIKKFNEAKAKGIHMPFVPETFMSIGTRSIYWCPRQERKILFLSRGEKFCYLDLLYQPFVVAIKEQYPLDYVTTQNIARELRIIHPRDHETGQLQVITTDLVAEYLFDDGTWLREAYPYKSHVPAAKRHRTREKYQIEKEYWRMFDVNYFPIFERDVDRIRAKNILILSERFLNNFSQNLLMQFSRLFLSKIQISSYVYLRALIADVSNTMNVIPQEGYSLFCTSVLLNMLPLDLSEPLDFVAPVKLLPLGQAA